jgi:hypothetical protein
VKDVPGMADVGRQRVERRLGDPKVLSEHVAGRALEPVGDQERLVLGEVAVVEHEQELRPLVERLDRMREPGWEVPQIAGRDVIEKQPTLLVEDAHPAAAGDHVRPLGLLVPVKLPDAARGQSHVDAGQLGRYRQFPDRHLARPAARKQAVVRCGKRELEIRNCARVGPRRRKVVWILGLEQRVSGTEDCRALFTTDRIMGSELEAVVKRRLSWRSHESQSFIQGTRGTVEG